MPSVWNDMPPAGERTVPRGELPVAPFADNAEYVAALFGVVAAQLAAAIGEREALQLIERAGDAAHVPELRVEVLRRITVLDVRREASRARQIPLALADAFDAWRLDTDERLLLACLLGAELSASLAGAVARCAGRPIAGVTVEVLAATLQAGDPGVLELVERLSPDGQLSALGLVGFADGGPFAQRRLAVAPRLFALAAGTLAADPTLGATLLVPRMRTLALVYAGMRDAHEQLRALLARDETLPVAVLAGDRGADVIAIASECTNSLARASLRLGEILPTAAWRDAVAREALLHRAVVIVAYDGRADLSPLVRRLAVLAIPIAVSCEGVPDPDLFGLPVVRIEVVPPDVATREQLWHAALDGVTAEPSVSPSQLALVRCGPAHIAHAVEHARLLALASGTHVVRREALFSGLRSVLAIPRLVFRDTTGQKLPEPAARHLAPVLEGTKPDAVIAIAGPNALAIAGALAARLHMYHVAIDASDADARTLDAAFACADANLALVSLDHVPPTLLARLRSGSRMIVLLTERMDLLDPAIRRLARVQVD